MALYGQVRATAFYHASAEPDGYGGYAESLLVTKERHGKVSLAARQKIATSVEENQAKNKNLDSIVEEVKVELQLDAAQQEQLRKDADTIAKMDSDIKEFSDDEQGIVKAIMAGAVKYSRNPRDVKRFINSFRFYYFLRSAREGGTRMFPPSISSPVGF